MLCEADAVSFTVYLGEYELTHSNPKLGMKQVVFDCIALCLSPRIEASGIEAFWQMVFVKY